MASMTGTDVVTYSCERPGMSACVLEEDVVYHTYSTYARGGDATRMGWNFPWVSSDGSDFSFDHNVSWTPEQQASGTHANQRLQIGCAESQAAAIKHTVITIEKTIGRIKRYLQLTTVMAAKQTANAHPVPRMSAKVSAGRPPSCHANIAAKR